MTDIGLSVVKFIKEADGLRETPRWGGKFAHDRSNVMEHTYRVMLWVKCILDMTWDAYREDNRYVVEDPETIIVHYRSLAYACMNYSLTHDLGERFTGDVNHKVKRRYPELKVLLDKVEDAEVARVLPLSPNLPSSKACWYDNKEVKEIVKIADMIDFMFEALKEISFGNPVQEYHEAIQHGIAGMKNYDSVFSASGNILIQSLFEEYNYTAPPGVNTSYA